MRDVNNTAIQGNTASVNRSARLLNSTRLMMGNLNQDSVCINEEKLKDDKEYIHNHDSTTRQFQISEIKNGDTMLIKEDDTYNSTTRQFQGSEIKNEDIMLEQKVEAPKLINSEYKNINDLLRVMNKGNGLITSEEKGVIVLGNTGSGKSTLTQLLSKQPLQAVYDDETGNMRIESCTIPPNNIRISHKKTSETKVPNKVKIGDIAIFDCPGFHDTKNQSRKILK